MSADEDHMMIPSTVYGLLLPGLCSVTVHKLIYSTRTDCTVHVVDST